MIATAEVVSLLLARIHFCSNNNGNRVRRTETLDERGLDFAAAGEVFDDPHLTIEDDRFDYGETRFFTIGFLAGRMVVIVWTPRGEDQRIISMRKANDPEQQAYGERLAGPGRRP